MKTILISGGAGYLGTAITQELLKKYKVIVYDKLYLILWNIFFLL